mmetsp:Transcript_92910/g.294682  ORF Transcript_92910/g.294682 Transcript_92910/m.294682 type:complete len:200 (+) Transcript_92910:261-860(+)
MLDHGWAPEGPRVQRRRRGRRGRRPGRRVHSGALVVMAVRAALPDARRAPPAVRGHAGSGGRRSEWRVPAPRRVVAQRGLRGRGGARRDGAAGAPDRGADARATSPARRGCWARRWLHPLACSARLTRHARPRLLRGEVDAGGTQAALGGPPRLPRGLARARAGRARRRPARVGPARASAPRRPRVRREVGERRDARRL